MTQPLGTLTAGDVFSYVQRQFGDEAGVQIVDSDVIRWINLATNEIVQKNGVLQAKASANQLSGTNTLTVPPDVMDLRGVEVDGSALVHVAKEEMASAVGSDARSGVPRYWYIWGNELNIWPIPNKAYTATIFYTRQPPHVVALGDILPVPDRYFERVCDYVMAKAYELDEDWGAHDRQMSRFEEKLKEATGAANTAGGAFQVITEVSYY